MGNCSSQAQRPPEKMEETKAAVSNNSAPGTDKTQPEPEALTRLKEREGSHGIFTKDSFQEEVPLESQNVPAGVMLNLPFYRMPPEPSMANETFQQFLKLLEVRKDEPHKTSHRSLYGHVKVCRLMMEGLKLEFLSQEKSFALNNDEFRPDLVFRWRRRDRDVIVVCEVQLPLNDRPKAVSANNGGKREFAQCSKALELFGEEVCLGLGFVQKKHEKQLVVVHSQGKYGAELVKLVERHGRKWQVIVAPNLASTT